MRAASHLSVVREDNLPPPLIPADVIIKDYPEALMPQDIFESDWWATAEQAERLYGFTLNMKCHTQKPSGSLPSDDRLLARLCECDVAEFRAVRDKVLEGWELCSDGRYYRRSIAIKVLAFWISRLFKRRSSAAGNAAQDRDVPDQDEFSRPIFQAEDALARLDATHKQVRKCRAHRAKLAKQNDKVTAAPEPTSNVANDLATPVGTPGGTPNRSPKVSEAKRSEEDSSSGFHPEDSRITDSANPEIEQEGRSIERTRPDPVGQKPIPPWPPDWLERFKARYPRRRSWGDAEKALTKLRKSGAVAFDDVMAGVDRLIAEGRDAKYLPYPASWIRDKGWEDSPDPASPPGPPTSGRGKHRHPGFAYLHSEGVLP